MHYNLPRLMRLAGKKDVQLGRQRYYVGFVPTVRRFIVWNAVAQLDSFRILNLRMMNKTGRFMAVDCVQ